MTITNTHLNAEQAHELVLLIQEEAKKLGFQQIGITDTNLSEHVEVYQNWIDNNYHADLDYMDKHGAKRWTAEQLIPGTLRVLSVRMDYMSDPESPFELLTKSNKAYISRYSLGRDYHKLIRSRLKKLIQFIKKTAQNYDLT